MRSVKKHHISWKTRNPNTRSFDGQILSLAFSARDTEATNRKVPKSVRKAFSIIIMFYNCLYFPILVVDIFPGV